MTVPLFTKARYGWRKLPSKLETDHLHPARFHPCWHALCGQSISYFHELAVAHSTRIEVSAAASFAKGLDEGDSSMHVTSSSRSDSSKATLALRPKEETKNDTRDTVNADWVKAAAKVRHLKWQWYAGASIMGQYRSVTDAISGKITAEVVHDNGQAFTYRRISTRDCTKKMLTLSCYGPFGMAGITLPVDHHLRQGRPHKTDQEAKPPSWDHLGTPTR